MELSVLLAVLAAAVMHAGWNVLVKLKLDRFLSLCLIQTLMGFMGVAMLLVFPLPALASLPYALASGVLHLGQMLRAFEGFGVNLVDVFGARRAGGELKVWDERALSVRGGEATAECAATLRGPGGASLVMALAVLRDGSVASGHYRGHLLVWG